MNIVTPIPTNVNFHTANVNTEMARRDNAVREVIPNTKELTESAKEGGLGSEGDKLKQAAQNSVPNHESKTQEAGENKQEKNNAEDESATKKDAEAKQQEKNEKEQERVEQLEIAELSARDREVRAHEQAHAAVGGQHAGSPTYEFKTGPDGKRYAVGGEVPIDISKSSDPQETLQKMQQVRSAALAPANPSAQDMRVAAEASAIAVEARADLAEQRSEELKTANQKAIDPEGSEESDSEQSAAEVDTTSESTSRSLDLLFATGNSSENKSLKSEDDVATAAGAEVASLESDDQVASAAGAEVASLESDDQVASAAGAEVASLETARPTEIDNRALRIANFYHQTSEPKAAGFSQIA